MTDKELITNNGIDDIVADKRIMYASREAGIRSFAETYSFNIESVLFNQLTLEQQKMWRKEIENAVINGGEMGLELADDKRYDKIEISKDLEEAANKFGIRQGVELKPFAIKFFKAGAEWQKQQIMKDAVDVFVNTYENTNDGNYVEFVTEQSPYKFKETEKCKIIIVKEDKQ